MSFSRIILSICLLFFLYSCGTAKKAFVNQKKNSIDEFLVEKKSPLVMPPDYEVLPFPSSSLDPNKTQNTNIKNLITVEEALSDKGKLGKNDVNFEENILKKIKNN